MFGGVEDYKYPVFFALFKLSHANAQRHGESQTLVCHRRRVLCGRSHVITCSRRRRRCRCCHGGRGQCGRCRAPIPTVFLSCELVRWVLVVLVAFVFCCCCWSRHVWRMQLDGFMCVDVRIGSGQNDTHYTKSKNPTCTKIEHNAHQITQNSTQNRANNVSSTRKTCWYCFGL